MVKAFHCATLGLKTLLSPPSSPSFIPLQTQSPFPTTSGNIRSSPIYCTYSADQLHLCSCQSPIRYATSSRLLAHRHSHKSKIQERSETKGRGFRRALDCLGSIAPLSPNPSPRPKAPRAGSLPFFLASISSKKKTTITPSVLLNSSTPRFRIEERTVFQAMAEESHKLETVNLSKKRRFGRQKGNKSKKKLKGFDGSGENIKIDRKMKKLFRKRAREYNSDDDDEVRYAVKMKDKSAVSIKNEEALDGKDSSEEEEEDHQDIGAEHEISEDEEGEIQPGITKFTEGCRAFRLAFKKIIKKNVSDVSLGPVLSGHKKLVAEKLAEEEAERKIKGEAKKEKHLLGEKGHVKPANFWDSHEKFLTGVATKGVVKLFNAVNKAQNSQKGLNTSRFKDEKAISKRRKEAFFSALGKTTLSTAPAKAHTSSGPVDGEGPAWAPLRDSYMLTSSKLKDWDKMPDSVAEDEIEKMPLDSSDDD